MNCSLSLKLWSMGLICVGRLRRCLAILHMVSQLFRLKRCLIAADVGLVDWYLDILHLEDTLILLLIPYHAVLSLIASKLICGLLVAGVPAVTTSHPEY